MTACQVSYLIDHGPEYLKLYPILRAVIDQEWNGPVHLPDFLSAWAPYPIKSTNASVLLGYMHNKLPRPSLLQRALGSPDYLELVICKTFAGAQPEAVRELFEKLAGFESIEDANPDILTKMVRNELAWLPNSGIEPQSYSKSEHRAIEKMFRESAKAALKRAKLHTAIAERASDLHDSHGLSDVV